MIHYTIDPRHRLIRSVIGGITTFEDFGDYVYQIILDDRFDPNFDAIITIEKDFVEKIVAREIEFKDLIEGYGKFRKGAKWAFILPDETYLPKLENSFAEVDLNSVRIRFFTTEQDAVDWIGDKTGQPLP